MDRVANSNKSDIHVEWSTNEKAALEVAAGGAYSGLNVMVTMKQVNLNVAMLSATLSTSFLPFSREDKEVATRETIKKDYLKANICAFNMGTNYEK